MARSAAQCSGILAGIHIVTALVVTIGIGFAPPAEGAIMILSFSQETPGEIARWAVTHDARLIGAGPVPHSLIVSGSRAALGGAALNHGSLLLAGRLAGCGEKRKA